MKIYSRICHFRPSGSNLFKDNLSTILLLRQKNECCNLNNTPQIIMESSLALDKWILARKAALSVLIPQLNARGHRSTCARILKSLNTCFVFAFLSLLLSWSQPLGSRWQVASFSILMSLLVFFLQRCSHLATFRIILQVHFFLQRIAFKMQCKRI